MKPPYRIRPCDMRYAKEDRVLPYRLQREVHRGYCFFWRSRGVAPPSVSVSVLEDAEDFLLWSRRWGAAY